MDNHHATIKFLGDDLDPAVITAALGCAPSEAATGGSPIVHTQPNGKQISRPSTTGYWLIAASCNEVQELPRLAEQLLERLSTSTEALKKLAKTYRGQLILSIGASDQVKRVELSGAFQERLARFGLHVFFEEL
jgi:hypothetical protein